MRVDVLTAVHAGYARYLPAAWTSLADQSHPDWTWHVQIDGLAGPARKALAACGALTDPRVRVAAHGTLEGPAVARNIALGRCDAPVVQNLDADDELEAHTLASLTDALREHPSAGFAVGHARDLFPDGTLRDCPLPLRPGVLPRGTLLAAWSTDGDHPPVHPAGVMWQRSLLLALGGWSALHRIEDTATLIAASALADGVLIDTPTLRYRRHGAQRSRQISEFSGGGGQIALVRERATLLLTMAPQPQPAKKPQRSRSTHHEG
ncbi:glycosyltransferase [Protofrankia symbiont of Coriaria ruscifolia]|uniref:glycosyltransferase n=1 Tax=Protofrankia symbiont of Coriaria ruscifolia TaxID=1306542 RepID=UPI0010414782|nr:glycosyltransferase [Protofrankia symbiont of Coriaria ruscifolia]